MSHRPEYHRGLSIPPERLGSISTAVQTATSVAPLHCERIALGLSRQVYDVLLPNEQQVLVKVGGSAERFYAEHWAMQESRAIGVPVANTRFIGEIEEQGKALAVCVEEKLPGVPLAALVQSHQIEGAELRGIISLVGGYLANIHALNTQGFGPLDASGVGPYRSWEDYLLAITLPPQRQHLRTIAEAMALSTDDLDASLTLLERTVASSTPVTPHLLHGDVKLDNMLVDKRTRKITGLIDFEGARSGDGTRDIAWFAFFHQALTPALLAGYTQNALLPEGFQKRLTVNLVHICLSLLDFYASRSDQKGITHAKNVLRASLQHFSSDKADHYQPPPPFRACAL